MHSMVKMPCHVQVAVVCTVSFKKAHVQPTAAHSVNIHHVEELIVRWIALHDIASSSAVSLGSDETVVH
jgi:hypothetical protein